MLVVTTPPRMRAAADHVGASLEAGLLQGRHQGRCLWLVAQALGSLDRGWSTTDKSSTTWFVRRSPWWPLA